MAGSQLVPMQSRSRAERRKITVFQGNFKVKVTHVSGRWPLRGAWSAAAQADCRVDRPEPL